MASLPPKPPSPLPEILRRIERAIDEGQKRHAAWVENWQRQQAEERARWEKWGEHSSQHWEQWARHQAKGVEKWAEHVGEWAEEVGRKHERHRWERRMERKLRKEQEREQRRALKRQREIEEANPLMGGVYAVVALVLAGMAVLHAHEMWWLIFIALGMGSSAARTFSNVRLQRQLQAGTSEDVAPREEARDAAPPKKAAKAEAPKEPEDPRTARVNALCDKLLAELRAGPGVLREVVHQPEQTVEGLRKSCHELARRERELRMLSSPEDERRLEDERATLTARLAGERDEVVKERLGKALGLLEEQRRQRAELATSASRLEAEHMRLYYTLESLYTQVLRVRSADAASADVAGAGLRQSVEQLGQEMDAVAEALEEVHRDAPPRERVPTR